jgi:hypothetical protein
MNGDARLCAGHFRFQASDPHKVMRKKQDIDEIITLLRQLA